MRLVHCRCSVNGHFLLSCHCVQNLTEHKRRPAAQGFTWQSNIILHCIIHPLGAFESSFHHCFPLSCPSGDLVDLNWIFKRQLLGRLGEGRLKMDF